VDFKLSDEQREMIDTLRRFRSRELAPRAIRWLNGEYPYENLRQLAQMGILGMSVPEEYGGSSASVLDAVLAMEEIGKSCYVTALAALGEIGVQTRIISEFAPEPLKRKWLPKIASGEFILAILLTEPDAGTDVPSYRTNTAIKGARAVVNGQKTLISRADIADLLIVFTRVNAVPGAAGIGCVIIEKGTPGYAAQGKYHTMGGEHLCEVVIENCEVPAENVILRDNGMKKLLSAFNMQRCLNASICLGMAEGAMEEAVKYLRERKAFGHPIGDFQGMRWKAADMLIEVEAGRGLLYRAAVSGNPFPDPTMAAMAKIYCNEMAIRVTSQAVQVHGGYGYVDEFAVSRLFRGARFGSLGGGTTETLRNLVGRRVVEHMDLATGVHSLNMF
jgi:alkylation response protein AidB-like acyl-CoA dehydrogenase